MRPIDELREKIDLWKKSTTDTALMSVLHDVLKQIDVAIYEMDHQEAERTWHRVEDELPPMLYQAEGDDFCVDYSLLVLAYREASHDFYLARQMDDGHGSTWGTDCFDELYGVTHWMPLPEPPQEVQE